MSEQPPLDPLGRTPIMPIRDALTRGTGVDVLVDQAKAETSLKLETDTKHGEFAAGVAVRKWYDGPLEYFGFASWRPKRK